MTNTEQEYVLGTGDDEVARLRLQHAVWRPDATAAWSRAGFAPRQTILDVGSGPGFASLDLAEVVGPTGRVVAVDQSARFLDHLSAQGRARGLTNVEPIRRDLASATFESACADGAWLRWVLAFVPNPRRALTAVASAIKPGGAIVVHEYVAYETWKLVPRDADFERFVAAVMASWRARGGEPNVGLEVPAWLEASGFEIESTRTITELVTRENHRWHWPVAFARSGLERLAQLGDVTAGEADRMRASVDALERGDAWMMTPAVVEIIARR